jgi:probable rRNA maturation factor
VQINIINEQEYVNLDLPLLKRIANETLALAAGEPSITIVFTGSERISELNRRFLGKADSTDVLAFPFGEAEDEGGGPLVPKARPAVLLGEVVVNAEKALDVAGGDALRAANEAALYMVHGILHLVGGYDDTTEDAAEKMHAREDDILDKFGISVD